MYIENPKTKGSGIKCVIPQNEPCRVGCDECFFSHGRSYLEPLKENLPNIPKAEPFTVYRINDGNDSSVDLDVVLDVAKQFPMKFYNTCFVYNMKMFDAPVVLTVNGGRKTDLEFTKCEDDRLMFVRFRANSWNFALARECIMWYAEKGIPVVMTWMAYHKEESIPKEYKSRYEREKRTINEYWCIKVDEWWRLMKNIWDSPYGKWVKSCGTADVHECSLCGNCLMFYFRKVSCWAQQMRVE